MLLDLLVRYILTPERILGLVWDILPIIGMCLVFSAWKEEWWKCLTPLYGTYIIYKHTWKKSVTMFLVKMFLDATGTVSMAYARKHVTKNLISAVMELAKNGNLQLGIDVEKVIWCVVIAAVAGLVAWILTRVTYTKVCDSLGINSTGLKIGTFLLPEIFLIVNYMCYKKQEKREVSV